MSTSLTAPVANQPSIRDFERSEALNQMISKSCWSPKESGWRPFQSAAEAAILQGEKIVLRGCHWSLEIISLEETSGVFKQKLSYTNEFDYVTRLTYEDLFRSAKVHNGNIPCGMPIQQVPPKQQSDT